MESLPQEKDNAFADAYIEKAFRKNDEFLSALNDATDLEQIKSIVSEFAIEDEEEQSTVFEIIEGTGEEVDAVTFSEEGLLRALDLIKDGVPEEDEVRSWIPHTKIAEAVLRVTQR